jgi:hypothetical protein
MDAEPKTKLTPASDPNLTLKDAMETVWHKGTVKIYPVTDSKLEELTAGYNSLYLIFFGVSIGAGISFLIACRSTIAASEKPYYLAACIATFGLAVLFGIAGFGNYRRARRAKANLYENSIPLDPPK